MYPSTRTLYLITLLQNIISYSVYGQFFFTSQSFSPSPLIYSRPTQLFLPQPPIAQKPFLKSKPYLIVKSRPKVPYGLFNPIFIEPFIIEQHVPIEVDAKDGRPVIDLEKYGPVTFAPIEQAGASRAFKRTADFDAPSTETVDIDDDTFVKLITKSRLYSTEDMSNFNKYFNIIFKSKYDDNKLKIDAQNEGKTGVLTADDANNTRQNSQIENNNNGAFSEKESAIMQTIFENKKIKQLLDIIE